MVPQHGHGAAGEAAHTAMVTSLVILTCSITRSERSGRMVIGSHCIRKMSGWKNMFGSVVYHISHQRACGRTQICFNSQGDPATVRSLLEESLTLYRELGDTHGLATCFCLSGQLALQQGDAAMARSLVEEGLVLYREIGGWEEGIGESLTVLGKVAAVQGDPMWAIRLYGAAEALRESVGTPVPPVERSTYERSVAAARAQLGEKTFATAWAEGRIMTVEQVLVAQGPASILSPSTGSSSAPPTRKPATDLTGLTTREVEVLRLLAQGLTSAQMAEQLVIGVVTVNFHVRSIYSKLGVTSRSAATRYALEHHLV